MAVFTNTARKWIILIVYILAVTIAFLYLLFPAETVKGYIGYRLAEMAPPDVSFDIGNLGLGIPPALTFGGIDVGYMDEPALKIDRMELIPVYSALLAARTDVKLNGDLAGGHFHGRTAMVNRNMEGDIKFSNISLGDLPVMKTHLPVAVTGAASGDIVFDAAGKINADLTFTDCLIDSDQPFMGMGKMAITRLDVRAEATNNRIDIKNIDLKGPQFSGTASGTIILAQPVEASRLNLTGTIKPHASIMQSIGALIPNRYLKEGGIRMRITGTADKPKFSMR